jgi:uncharacterized protein (DUF2132 family)
MSALSGGSGASCAAAPIAPFRMNRPHSNDPLHGITLETIVQQLVEWLGWEELGRRIEIRCFTHDPSVKSSLTFLRKTPWARAKVEQLYVRQLSRRRGPASDTPPEQPPTGS